MKFRIAKVLLGDELIPCTVVESTQNVYMYLHVEDKYGLISIIPHNKIGVLSNLEFIRRKQLCSHSPTGRRHKLQTLGSDGSNLSGSTKISGWV